MNITCIFLILIIIVIIILLVGINDYNKISTINIKIINSNNKIIDLLNKEYQELKKIVDTTNKIKIKKDYFKDFNSFNIDTSTTYELDKVNIETLDLLIKLIEDNKELNTKETKESLKEINEINHKLMATKKYFNKNNNSLMKLLKGRYKIVAKLTKIVIRNSYETKEPTN